MRDICLYRNFSSKMLYALHYLWHFVRKNFYRKSQSHIHRLSRSVIESSDTHSLFFTSLDFYRLPDLSTVFERLQCFQRILFHKKPLVSIASSHSMLSSGSLKRQLIDNLFFAIHLLFNSSSNLFCTINVYWRKRQCWLRHCLYSLISCCYEIDNE